MIYKKVLWEFRGFFINLMLFFHLNMFNRRWSVLSGVYGITKILF
ncbi:hypothetical protein HMPREF9412_1501 [Paenibacillus sp. HGF5]|nr:hypothetical protein HMPREF9412_1501 [Paenibacillus sp. HGF5]